MMPKFIPTKFHQMLADKLQKAYERVAAGEDVRLIIEVQPQIGKSTEVSELFPAWILGQEDWPIICGSYGADLAQRKSQACRDILDSEVYKYVFPEVRLNPDSTSKEFWRTNKKGSYKAVGVGGGLTGNPGKFLIADDLIADKAQAESQNERERVWDWWNTVFYTRKQSKSGIILVETRWHLDDPAGKLEDQQKRNEAAGVPPAEYDKWERLTLPAIAEEDEYIDGVLFRKAGDVLAEERFTKEDLIKTRNAYIHAGKISDWASLYMQNPVINENATFRQAWFKYYEPKNLVGKNLSYTTTVDLAISQKKTADNTVIRTVAKDKDGPNWYLMEETAGIMDPLQTIDAIFHHWKLYRSKVYVESVAYQAALQYFIIEEQRKRQEYFTIEELKVKNTSKKEERIKGLVNLYKAGVIWHRKGQDEALEMELMQFPKGRRDDRADTLSMQQQVVRHTPRQVAENNDMTTAWKRKKTAEGVFNPRAPFNKV